MNVIEAVNRLNFLTDCEGTLERSINTSKMHGYSDDTYVLQQLTRTYTERTRYIAHTS